MALAACLVALLGLLCQTAHLVQLCTPGCERRSSIELVILCDGLDEAGDLVFDVDSADGEAACEHTSLGLPSNRDEEPGVACADRPCALAVAVGPLADPASHWSTRAARLLGWPSRSRSVPLFTPLRL